MDKKSKIILVSILISVIILSLIVFSGIINNKNSKEGNASSDEDASSENINVENTNMVDNENTNIEEGEDTSIPDEEYFTEENEEKNYKIETDKQEKVAGFMFYNFKMKDYKNGYQKIEITVKNDTNDISKSDKKFMLEALNYNDISVTIMNFSVKSLKPGEEYTIEMHLPGEIKEIKNFRIKEYLLQD